MNWNLLGNEWAVQLFSEHVAKGRLRHAYLITGPQGVGRRTLALRLAQAINCPQPVAPGQPCESCQTCRRLDIMQHPDLTVVQAETAGGRLKVDQVRELQHSLALAPYEARYRVALLLRFEEANPNAANALLKTLEEPPSQVVLVLTASDSESLLPTIVSRCETVRLHPIPLETVRHGLQERWGVPPEQADLLAHLSSGRLGYAVTLFQHPEQLEQRNDWLEELETSLPANRVQRFALAETLVSEKRKEYLRPLLQVWLSYWRDVLLCAARAKAPLTNIDHTNQIQKLSGQVDLGSARKAISNIENTLNLLDKNANAKLALEVMMLDLPRAS